MLVEDHRKVADLFEQFESTKDPARKRDLLGVIKNELETHTKVEEELFYPAAEKTGEKKLQDEVEEAHGEHDKMKQMLNQAEGLDPESGEFDATVAGLKGAVEQHVSEEEGEIFPDARRLFTEEELVEMGRRIKERKSELHAGNGSRGGGRSLVGRIMGR